MIAASSLIFSRELPCPYSYLQQTGCGREVMTHGLTAQACLDDGVRCDELSLGVLHQPCCGAVEAQRKFHRQTLVGGVFRDGSGSPCHIAPVIDGARPVNRTEGSMRVSSIVILSETRISRLQLDRRCRRGVNPIGGRISEFLEHYTPNLPRIPRRPGRARRGRADQPRIDIASHRDGFVSGQC